MPALLRGRQPNAKLFKTTVQAVRDLSEDLFLLDLTGFPADFALTPGCFLHLRVSIEDHPLLRRPFSIQSYDNGVATLLIREVGIGTTLLRALREGQAVDTLGPLGTRFSRIETTDRVLMVGGGVGVAPLLAACYDAEEGAEVDFCYGVRTKSEVQGLEPFRQKADTIRFHLSTDDGSIGFHGFNTQVAARLLDDGERFTKVFTCGPWIMMAKTAEMAESREIPLEASLEVQMGCGLGACLSCVYQSVEGDFIRSCIDGPVVDGRDVVWSR